LTDTSTTFKQAAFASETEKVVIALLTFSSDELVTPIYVASDAYELLPEANVKGVLSNEIEYVYLPFDIYLPRDDKTGTVSAKLRIENIDRQIIGTLRSITKPVSIKIQIVLSDDVDRIEVEYDNFKLSNVTYNAMYIEGDITLDYWGLEPFPSGRFTPSGFPGIF